MPAFQIIVLVPRTRGTTSLLIGFHAIGSEECNALGRAASLMSLFYSVVCIRLQEAFIETMLN